MVRLSVQLVLAACLASFVAAIPVERSKVFSVPVRRPTYAGRSVKDIIAKDLARHSKNAASDDTVPVTNEVDSYIIETTANGQTFNLIVDSGSSNTWVGAGTKFKTSGATSTGDTVSVSYGSGSFSGKEYLTAVSLSDDLSVSQQSIGVASKSTGFSGVDGILGIGPVDLTEKTVTNEDTVPTFPDNLLSQGTIDTEVVGVSFAPLTGSESSASNGQLDFGGVDKSKYTGSLTYVDVSTNEDYGPYWGLTVSSIKYGSTSVGSSNGAIVDTGTTLIYIPSTAYTKFLKAAGGTTDSSSGLSSFKKKPTSDVTFTIGGTAFTLTPDQYLIPNDQYANWQLSGSDYYSYIYDGGAASEGVNFILGQKFLENFYVAFDTTNSRIGLAPSA